MTRIGMKAVAVALVAALALVTIPLAFAEPGEGRGQEGRDRAAEARAHGAAQAANDTDENETELDDNATAEPEDNETAEADDGPPAWVLERRQARENGTWVPPGLLVALENVPDFLKERFHGLIAKWSDGANATADANETAEAASNETAEPQGEHGPRGKGAEMSAEGRGKALENVPAFVRAKLAALWGIFG